jgi:hypothetical protein
VPNYETATFVGGSSSGTMHCIALLALHFRPKINCLCLIVQASEVDLQKSTAVYVSTSSEQL